MHMLQLCKILMKYDIQKHSSFGLLPPFQKVVNLPSSVLRMDAEVKECASQHLFLMCVCSVTCNLQRGVLTCVIRSKRSALFNSCQDYVL